MSSGTLISKISGQIRTIFLVGAIGALGQVADAFDVANNIPTSLNLILTGGIFNAILVPQIAKAKLSKNADFQISKLITFASSFILIITVLLTILTPIIISLIAGHEWSVEQKDLAIIFGFYCMPQVFFYGIFTIFGQLLASYEKFGAYSWAPIANNIVSIIVLGVFIILTGGFGHFDRQISSLTPALIFLLAGGATLGIIAQSALLLIPLKQLNLHFRPVFGVHGFGLKSIFKVSIWSFAMICLEQFVSLLFVNIASSAPSEAVRLGLSSIASTVGGNAAYTNALIIYIIPHSLVTVTLQTALFTKISDAVHSQNHQKAKELTLKGCYNIIALVSVFVAIFMSLYIPIVKVLVPSASNAGVDIIGKTVYILSLMLIPAGVFQMITRLFFAYGKMKQLFLIELIEYPLAAIAVLCFTHLFAPQNWILIIAICKSLSTLIGMIVIIHFAKIKKSTIYSMLIRCSFAAYLASIVGSRTITYFVHFDLTKALWIHDLIVCIAISLEVTIVYLIIAHILKVKEIKEVMISASYKFGISKFIKKGKND